MDSRRKNPLTVPDVLITSKIRSAEEQARLGECVMDSSRLLSRREACRFVEEVCRRAEARQAQKKVHEHMISFERNLVEEIHAKHRGCKVLIDIIRSAE